MNNKNLKTRDSKFWRDSYYHRMLGLKAANEVERLLPLFEKENPNDKRPREAVEAIRAWAQGKRKLGMAEVRKLSLGSHAAARGVKFVNDIYKKAIVEQGFGEGSVPINTLYTEPETLFAEPLAAQSTSGSNLMTVGVSHDTLLTVGWLDLSKGPLVLHVPDFSGRYYSVQFTDPFDVDFAYVGTRVTGTGAGDCLITGPAWKGIVPQGMRQISSPNNSVLVLGRVLVDNDSDVSAAYNLSKQIQLAPLSQR